MNFNKKFIPVKQALFIIFIMVVGFAAYLIYQQFYGPRGTILFIPGLGLKPSDYTTLITNLKAHRYTVITYTSNDTAVPDYQTTVRKWTDAVSPIVGNKKVIVIGHSVGGAVAVHFCANDKRCIAGIDLDGGAAFAERLQVPFLYIQADTGSYCDMECMGGRFLMEKISNVSGTQVDHISGIKHFNFTDLRTQKLKNMDYLGSIDGRAQINAAIDVFLASLN